MDFSGDKIIDFIVTTKLDKEEYKICEYWITSENNLIRIYESYQDGIKIRKIINLDNDPEMEVISAYGYEDGIDWILYRY